jgi:transcriptional regulator with XRE-family HTH domain
MPTARQIGMKLKKTREAKGLSQTELARKARVSRAYVFRLEAGGSDPTVGVLQRLAKGLGVPVTALLE